MRHKATAPTVLAGRFAVTGWIFAQAVFEADVLVQNAENSDGPNLGVPMNPKVMSLAAVAALACTTSAPAHHSFAMFDAARTITVQGTVTQFRWTNPHSWLHVAARDERTGKAGVWAIELDSPARLIASGIRADYVRAGDTVSVSFHPSRDGTRRGQFVQAAPLGRR